MLLSIGDGVVLANAIIVGAVPFLSNDISNAGRGKPSAVQRTSNGSPSTNTKQSLLSIPHNSFPCTRDDECRLFNRTYWTGTRDNKQKKWLHSFLFQLHFV